MKYLKLIQIEIKTTNRPPGLKKGKKEEEEEQRRRWKKRRKWKPTKESIREFCKNKQTKNK